MLGLKLATDPRWVKNAVEQNIEEILTDHAYCEQKAASHAISLIVQFPEYAELVDEMTDLAMEEMSHFKMVHEMIRKRGFKLGWERKDSYVGDLMKFAKRVPDDRKVRLVNKLLFAAMIEARSCERFKVLSDHIKDEELAKFYFDLMASEARHYTTFLRLAKSVLDPEVVEARWQEWLAYEAEVISQYGTEEPIHG